MSDIQQPVPRVSRFRLNLNLQSFAWLSAWMVLAFIAASARQAIGSIVSLLLAALFLGFGLLGIATFGDTVGWRGALSRVVEFVSRHRSVEYVDHNLKFAPIHLANQDVIYEVDSGLGLRFTTVKMGDIDDFPRYVGVVRNPRRKTVTVYLQYSGHSLLTSSRGIERDRIDRGWAEALKRAGFESDGSLSVTQVTARRPTSEAALVERMVDELHPVVLKALLRSDEASDQDGSATIGDNVVERLETQVVDGVQYIHAFAVTASADGAWRKSLKHSDPESLAQSRFTKALEILRDLLREAGFQDVRICSYVETHRLLKSLLNVANLPEYISELESDRTSNRALKDSVALRTSPWPTSMEADGRIVTMDQDTYHRPFRRSDTGNNSTAPGGLDEFLLGIEGWYMTSMKLDIKSMTNRRVRSRTVDPVMGVREVRLAERLGEDDPEVQELRQARLKQRDDEFASKGNDWDTQLVVVVSSDNYQECLRYSRRFQDLVTRHNPLEFKLFGTRRHRVAAVYQAAGIPV